jgi:molybdopterin-guanine dinucleotide biosynthesis protein A
MTAVNITAMLLAGGESRRMGRDKAMLVFRGKPLWQTQVECLEKLHPAEILLSARSDPAWRPGNVRFVADAAPSRGPLSGLAAALDAARTPHLLALAVDIPFMTAKYLRSLCNLIEPGRGVLPVIGDRAEPLAAIYPVEAHVDLAAALRGSDSSLQSLTASLIAAGKLRAIAVAQRERALFRNFNEPADLIYSTPSLNRSSRGSSPLSEPPRTSVRSRLG